MHSIIPHVFSICPNLLFTIPFYTMIFVRLFGPLLEIVKGLFGPLPKMVKGLSGPLLEMVKGICLEPAMLCQPPPLASSRRGWMILPDMEDYV